MLSTYLALGGYYTFKGAGYTRGGESSIDDANVFSIPIDVTLAKEFSFSTCG